MSDKADFEFEIWYFKESGKFYTEAKVTWSMENIATDGQPPTPAMWHAVAKLRGLRDNGGPEALPGLCCNGWPGPIVINCEQGFPCLLMPNK